MSPLVDYLQKKGLPRQERSLEKKPRFSRYYNFQFVEDSWLGEGTHDKSLGGARSNELLVGISNFNS